MNTAFNERRRRLPGAAWSKTLNGWTIPDTIENRKKCRLPLQNLPAVTTQTSAQTLKAALTGLSLNNKEQMQKFLQHLQLKAYSPLTIRTYRNEFTQLLQAIGKHPVQQLSAEQIKRYLLQYMNKGCSENTIHSRMNAVKFYFEKVLGKSRMFIEIPRPKRPFQLPGVFSKEDVTAIINSVENLKQKTILMLTYACGLRVSEVVSLSVADIDSKRMLIHIKRAKGKKDRVVSISPTLLIMLREYYKKYKPVKYLFEGNRKDEHYSTRSIQLVLHAAKERAGIIKSGAYMGCVIVLPHICSTRG